MDDKEVWGFDDTPQIENEDIENDLAIVQAQAGRRIRRRHAIAASSAAVAISIVVVFASVNVKNQKSAITPVTRPTPATTVTVVGPTTTAIADPANDRPSVLVAVVASTKLVTLDPKTGSILKTLVDVAKLYPTNTSDSGIGGAPASINKISYDRATQTVYLITWISGDCGGGSIQSVPISGGPMKHIHDFASSIAVSPDGQSLAYNNSAGCQGDGDIVVRSLSTGKEVTISKGPSDANSNDIFSTIQWSYDGSAIFAEVSHSASNGSYTEVVKKFSANQANQDRTTAPTLSIKVDQTTDFANPSIGSAINGHEILVYKNVDQSKNPATLEVVDVDTGTTRTLMSLDRTKHYSSASSDQSGQHVLFVESASSSAKDGDLIVSDHGSSKKTVLAHNISAAAW